MRRYLLPLPKIEKKKDEMPKLERFHDSDLPWMYAKLTEIHVKQMNNKKIKKEV